MRPLGAMSRTLRPAPLLALALLPVLGGCIAKTAVDVATLPVRAASQGVDWATTSQSEADEKRGRAMREHEEKLRDLQRRYEKHLRKCDEGSQSACLDARDDYAQMQILQAPQNRPY
ncbi:hypothetical protein [Novosphingobium mangrovi (ex Hu et al. 2023)]|uniref:Lipoprotein n=1 Tax=Novosphingobium mangrovi (ex Hu et al. 2023) TaxID=2930094 RepID=A0ABT0AAY7_9SPHN|nr:hypothetical protein [Novosphingobium mangrovi (ex Hu et al. 2023)]MCJ1960358.1 hypothetical protein [Novosphingobium mangrovi (ex Hu et al. 2023)]